MHISFVILHYMTIEDTIECIESIRNKVDYCNYSIIVIDNASPNLTGKELEKKYKSYKEITVIISEDNLGFAKGNNIGFRYAKSNDADFIVMINNDTLIEQYQFCNKIEELYKKHKFYILGPDIISTKDNGHQNPRGYNNIKKSHFKKTIIKHRIQLILNYLRVEDFFTKIKKIITNEDNLQNLSLDNDIENYILHGSCLIFSSNYIKLFDGIYDKTFMYGEEEILFYLMRKLKLKCIYSPDIQIYHKEATSTSRSISNLLYKKKRFFYRNKIESCKNILRDLENTSDINNLLKNRGK